MKVIKMLFVLPLLLILTFSGLLADKDKEADQILGVWFNELNTAKIHIYKKNNKYHGKIIWLKEPNNEKGEPKIDDKNDDPEKQKRPILGLMIVWNFVYDGDNEWDDGYIYDPRNGSTYSCNMTLSEDGNTLDVRGYIGISLFGRTTVWTRTKSEQPE